MNPVVNDELIIKRKGRIIIITNFLIYIAYHILGALIKGSYTDSRGIVNPSYADSTCDWWNAFVNCHVWHFALLHIYGFLIYAILSYTYDVYKGKPKYITVYLWALAFILMLCIPTYWNHMWSAYN